MKIGERWLIVLGINSASRESSAGVYLLSSGRFGWEDRRSLVCCGEFNTSTFTNVNPWWN